MTMATWRLVASEALFTAVQLTGFALLFLLPFSSAIAVNTFVFCFLKACGVANDALALDAHGSSSVTLSLTHAGKISQAECAWRLLAQLVIAPLAIVAVLGHSALGLDLRDLSVPRYEAGAAAPWLFATECLATFTLLTLIFNVPIPGAADVGGVTLGGFVCPGIVGVPVGMNPAMNALCALSTGHVDAYAPALLGTLTAAVAHGVASPALDRIFAGKAKQDYRGGPCCAGQNLATHHVRRRACARKPPVREAARGAVAVCARMSDRPVRVVSLHYKTGSQGAT
eukprot:CAMPEP_0206009266 /NCGR_PEP_ID=MMETSP1464-20131121/9336_1 /ASSEMBLY_ACC=CAM_ASM_001124 /TAXON_ID=119497 /ORGANISM="Exanthemachrysis gayraliae, Strain RCC1523" /LENGTH=283 /DNA_ID=CAMNT_0053382857 /DNA_START=21 /DNA_END=869 /DNA_ORIENTATION=-